MFRFETQIARVSGAIADIVNPLAVNAHGKREFHCAIFSSTDPLSLLEIHPVFGFSIS